MLACAAGSLRCAQALVDAGATLHAIKAGGVDILGAALLGNAPDRALAWAVQTAAGARAGSPPGFEEVENMSRNAIRCMGMGRPQALSLLMADPLFDVDLQVDIKRSNSGDGPQASGESALGYAAGRGAGGGDFEALAARSKSLDKPNLAGKTALWAALAGREGGHFLELLKAGASAEACGGWGALESLGQESGSGWILAAARAAALAPRKAFGEAVVGQGASAEAPGLDLGSRVRARALVEGAASLRELFDLGPELLGSKRSLWGDEAAASGVLAETWSSCAFPVATSELGIFPNFCMDEPPAVSGASTPGRALASAKAVLATLLGPARDVAAAQALGKLAVRKGVAAFFQAENSRVPELQVFAIATALAVGGFDAGPPVDGHKIAWAGVDEALSPARGASLGPSLPVQVGPPAAAALDGPEADLARLGALLADHGLACVRVHPRGSWSESLSRAGADAESIRAGLATLPLRSEAWGCGGRLQMALGMPPTKKYLCFVMPETATLSMSSLSNAQECKAYAVHEFAHAIDFWFKHNPQADASALDACKTLLSSGAQGSDSGKTWADLPLREAVGKAARDIEAMELKAARENPGTSPDRSARPSLLAFARAAMRYAAPTHDGRAPTTADQMVERLSAPSDLAYMHERRSQRMATLSKNPGSTAFALAARDLDGLGTPAARWQTRYYTLSTELLARAFETFTRADGSDPSRVPSGSEATGARASIATALDRFDSESRRLSTPVRASEAKALARLGSKLSARSGQDSHERGKQCAPAKVSG